MSERDDHPLLDAAILFAGLYAVATVGLIVVAGRAALGVAHALRGSRSYVERMHDDADDDPLDNASLGD